MTICHIYHIQWESLYYNVQIATQVKILQVTESGALEGFSPKHAPSLHCAVQVGLDIRPPSLSTFMWETMRSLSREVDQVQMGWKILSQSILGSTGRRWICFWRWFNAEWWWGGCSCDHIILSRRRGPKSWNNFRLPDTGDLKSNQLFWAHIRLA